MHSVVEGKSNLINICEAYIVLIDRTPSSLMTLDNACGEDKLRYGEDKEKAFTLKTQKADFQCWNEAPSRCDAGRKHDELTMLSNSSHARLPPPPCVWLRLTATPCSEQEMHLG